MLTEREILATQEMIQNEHLDVRAVTLGINLLDCASSDLAKVKDDSDEPNEPSDYFKRVFKLPSEEN